MRLKMTREWRRIHSDGSNGFIHELESGPFAASDVVPRSYGTRNGVVLLQAEYAQRLLAQ